MMIQALGKEDFLRLLVTQLRHQDPLEPLDAQDFASQLAEFTALEQQIHTNELLEQEMEFRTSEMIQAQNSAAIGLIGQRIVTTGDQLELSATGPRDAFVTTSDAAAVHLELLDSAGNVALAMDTTVAAAGVHRIDLGAAAAGLAAGTYTLSVQVLGNGTGVQASPLSSGVVLGVRPGSAGPVLVVGNEEVQLSKVLEITH
ncbi:MAG: flagellar hook capping FlgD N-terminal domain-containing protein [Longimicrobiales bacterium]